MLEGRHRACDVCGGIIPDAPARRRSAMPLEVAALLAQAMSAETAADLERLRMDLCRGCYLSFVTPPYRA